MALLVTEAPGIRCNAARAAAVVCTECMATIHLDARSPRLRRMVHALARVHRCATV